MQKIIIVILFIKIFTDISFCQWNEYSTNIPKNWDYLSAIDTDGNNDIAIGYKNKVIYSENGGDNWTEYDLSNLIVNGIIDISIKNGNIWICDAGRIFRSQDKGLSWEIQYEDTSIVKFIDYLEMFDGARGIAVGSAKSPSAPAPVLRTFDSGNTWESMNSSELIGCASNDLWRRVSFSNDSVGFFYTNRLGLQKTINGGKNWEKLNAGNGVITILKFYNNEYGIFWGYNANNGKSGVFRTTNSGITWDFTELNAISCMDIEFVKNNPSVIWMCDLKQNIFHSSDSGKTWVPISKPYPETKAWDIVMVNKDIGWLLGTGSLLKYSTPTNINDNQFNIPNGYKLFQNYPNPFNPETLIKFNIPEAGFVTLKIYDILGNEIRTLLSKDLNPGTYEVKYKAEQLSSGVYIYKLVTSKFMASKKLLYIK